MGPAVLALVSGSLLARFVLWPIEMKLEHRYLAQANSQLAELEREMREDR